MRLGVFEITCFVLGLALGEFIWMMTSGLGTMLPPCR